MAGSIAPGSALSCLDELAGEAVESACEKGVFASPESVAAAVKYVTAQLALIDDGTAYSKRDASYAAELAPLRTAVELDRFGLVAQVLKEREGCTVDHCDALTRFHESSRVLGNLRDRTFEAQVKKYAAIWNAPRPAERVVAGPSVALPETNGPGTVASGSTPQPHVSGRGYSEALPADLPFESKAMPGRVPDAPVPKLENEPSPGLAKAVMVPIAPLN
jgi:hypothetical protein